jgi:hypothetical protein
MRFNNLASTALVLALAACTTTTPYKPAEGPHSTGYADERLASNRYRITFHGNSATRRETVENFLLLRAAEVTRNAGFEWFAFDQRDTEAKTTYITPFAGYPYWGAGWGRFGWYHRSWLYDPWDPFWADNPIPRTRYEAYAEIVMLTPAQAKDDAHALNAADVIARLGPAAAPPPAAPH